MNAIVLVEVVRERVRCGVAAVVVGPCRLRMLRCGEEAAAAALFSEWAMEAQTSADCCAAVEHAVHRGGLALGGCAEVQCFASAEEMPESAASGVVFVPMETPPSPPPPLSRNEEKENEEEAEGEDGACEFIAKIYGSPVAWAMEIERVRIPQLIEWFLRLGASHARYVSLGATRLRVSQSVLSDDCLIALTQSSPPPHFIGEQHDDLSSSSSPSPAGGIVCLTSRKVPRTAFTVQLGRQTLRSATACAHYFLVEVMWLEKRRDTPRHHVTFLWTDTDNTNTDEVVVVVGGGEVERCSTVTSLAMEAMRGDAELREERRGKRLGGAPSLGTYEDHSSRLLLEPPVPPVRGIYYLAVTAQCTERAQLERFTVRVAVWQLRCLCHRAGTEMPQLQATFGEAR